MCDKAIHIHLSVIQFVPEYFKTQEMCDKAVDTCIFVFDSIADRHKSQTCVIKYFLKILKSCLDRYKSEEMCKSCW